MPYLHLKNETFLKKIFIGVIHDIHQLGEKISLHCSLIIQMVPQKGPASPKSSLHA